MYKILIIGLGNLLMSDDGLGVVALKELQKRYKQYDKICFLDAGTSVLNYVTDIANTETLIAIDAITAGRPAGTIYRIDEKDIHMVGCHHFSLDSHCSSLFETVALSRKLTGFPTRILIYGIEPHICEVGFFISPHVEKSLKRLVDKVQQDINSLCLEITN